MGHQDFTKAVWPIPLHFGGGSSIHASHVNGEYGANSISHLVYVDYSDFHWLKSAKHSFDTKLHHRHMRVRRFWLSGKPN